MALRASVYMAAMGPEGLKEVAQLCHDNASYFAAEVQKRGLLKFPGKPFFNEVLIELPDVNAVMKRASEAGILAGHDVSEDYPEYRNSLLVAFTEKRTKSQIDALLACL